jgi:hypothetical protein
VISISLSLIIRRESFSNIRRWDDYYPESKKKGMDVKAERFDFDEKKR